MLRLLRSKLRTPFFLLSGLTLLLFSLPHLAHAVPYTFTKIDEQVEPGIIFAFTPTINNAGTVAFLSSLGVQTGSGGPLRPGLLLR
jgi:hypothetical protein